MSQSVDKLKQLLFQPESDAIAALTTRIEAVFDRAGTNDRFRKSVASVLEGALREAEVDRHDEMAAAIAPLIVKTVKTEIHNSTDDLVEALYPATGRMVKAYVASAIRDLTNEVNRRLEQNPVMLRINALWTGRSVAELALAGSQKVAVEDVFLIQRATGELVGRWPEGKVESNLDHVMGGVLTTINEFTSEAFKAEGAALRQIDLGEHRVYLRASPTYLLAARCSGTPSPGVEQVFDEEFLNLLGNRREALESIASADPGRAASRLLGGLATRIEERLAGLRTTSRMGGIRPLTLLAALIGLPLIGLLGWNAYVDYRLASVERTARAAISRVAGMHGFPASVRADDRGHALTISGLAPDPEAKEAVLRELAKALPGVAVTNDLAAVQAPTADLAPLKSELQQGQQAFESKVQARLSEEVGQRVARNLRRTAELLKASAPTGADKTRWAQMTREAEAIAGDLQSGAGAAGGSSGALQKRIETLAAQIRAGAASGLAGAAIDEPPSQDVMEAANSALSAAQNIPAMRALAALANKPVPPRDQLSAYIRGHAIFFNENASFRDEAAANLVLDEVTRLMKASGESVLRVAGYTDDQGTQAKNLSISKSRSEAVTAALIARGIPANRLVQLNRISLETNISPTNGPASPNRRVEFELGFIGEGGR